MEFECHFVNGQAEKSFKIKQLIVPPMFRRDGRLHGRPGRVHRPIMKHGGYPAVH